MRWICQKCESSSNRDAIEFCSIPFRASAHATCPCVKLRSSESTKGAESLPVPGQGSRGVAAPSVCARELAIERRRAPAYPGHSRFAATFIRSWRFIPNICGESGTAALLKTATLFHQMKQKQSQNRQIIDRESRSLIPLQHSLIARLNSLLSRKNSLLGCLGNWPRKHLRSLTFSGTEVSRSSRIERNSLQIRW